mmetsp:Transcript_15369/g.24241  ORF Transcript_15369/g.24241 Transcript_15369/m.24241 type:complete len:338 (+) Transcript_15369:26-1039(+)|eukprot:CAMPEP_0194714034 /NCGR_PEP_ID=MMETSP0296-20130528/5747_1 /TAXON_ID=39354 /ORGANISM="Heterosigma akashiwo, Strain CCMP2393" /LENGTH=337 /DNA_ID=CAMNT_0039613005 /DNA_START=14 /DNA_END=1027 /DNA_ORIENTATION=+
MLRARFFLAAVAVVAILSLRLRVQAFKSHGRATHQIKIIRPAQEGFMITRARFIVGGITTALSPLVVSPSPAKAELDREVASLFRKADLEASQGNIDNALQLYNKVVKLAPDFPNGWSNRGNMQVAKGNLEKAREDYSKALAIGLNDKDDWVVHLNRGTVYLALGQAGEALEDFDAAAASPGGRRNALVLQNRAQALERAGRWAEAEADYGKALQSAPGEVRPYWLRLALVLLQLGRPADGLALARRVLARYPGELEARAAVAALTHGPDGMGYAQAVKVWSYKEGEVTEEGLRLITSREYLENTLHWPPLAVKAFTSFLQTYKKDQVATLKEQKLI